MEGKERIRGGVSSCGELGPGRGSVSSGLASEEIEIRAVGVLVYVRRHDVAPASFPSVSRLEALLIDG